jgi:orotate phosphoribosyltransferase
MAIDALDRIGAVTVAVAVIVDRGAGPSIIERGFEYRAAYSLSDLELD